MIEEKPFFFRTGGKPLYGVIYLPEGKVTGRGLVICDSLFEEKFWCERVFSNLARRMAEEGFTVLSFDYYGYGNSGGESEDVTVRSLEGDVNAACDLLLSLGTVSLSLLGIRWGAAVAARAAVSRDEVDGLFLVNPVTGWKKQIMKALRANVAGQYSIFKKAVMTREQIVEELVAGGSCVRAGYRMNNIEGYLISKDFFEQSSSVELPEEYPAHVRTVSIFTIPERQVERADGDEGEKPEDSAGGPVIDESVIPDDNAFWINNRIFTSVAPGLTDAVCLRMKKLPSPPARASRPGGADEMSDSCVIGGVREWAVKMPTGRGYDLYAVVYDPLESKKEYGFVFTHGGLIGMNGAFRFNTRAARRFAAAGFPCVCGDTMGMGRSGGLMENQEQRVLFRKICGGLFAPDVESAADVLRERTGAAKVAPFGVCGGAITNILAQSGCRGIDESVLLSIPVMLPSLDYGEVRMSEGYARFYLGMYAGKIFNPKAWWRLVTGKSESDKIFKSLAVTFRGALRKLGMARAAREGAGEGTRGPGSPGKTPGSRGTEAAPPAREVKSGLSVAVPGAGDDLQFNDAFLEAYRRIVSRGERLLFIFGEHDNFKWEFNSEFVEGMPDEYAAGEGLISVEEIPHANHMYTLREWQERIVDRCMDWAGTGLSRS